MIELRVHAGLCNRMKEMASTIALAKAADQPLVVYWLKNKYLNCSYGQLFEPIEGIRVVDIETGRAKALFSRASLRYQIRTVREPIDLFLGNKQIEEYKAAGTDLVSQVAGVGRCVIISYYRFMQGADTLDDFRPRRAIREEVDRAAAEFGTGGVVGVHIRGTDNTQAIEQSPVNAFAERMRREVRRDPSVRFFLATDEPAVEQTISREFPGRVIVRPKVFARDKAQGVRDALVDLLLLSRCRAILGSHWSSFTEVAAELGGVPREIVTAQGGA